MLNPWVRSEASLAHAMVKTYYAQRLFERAFWTRLLSGQVPFRNLVIDPARAVFKKFALSVRAPGTAGSSTSTHAASPLPASEGTLPSDAVSTHAVADLPSLLQARLSQFGGRLLTVLSGNDLTAAETEALMQRDKRWRNRLDRRGEILRVPSADHTFSERERWVEVIDWISTRIRA